MWDFLDGRNVAAVAEKPNYAYLQHWAGLRAGSMLDIAPGVLVLASVGIFLAHAVDAYRAQLKARDLRP